jgi:hypothetical protein
MIGSDKEVSCPKLLVKAMSAAILALLERPEHSEEVVGSLKLSGHSVIACKNFADAMCILRNNQVSLIISDVHLENGGNVFDFLRWVKQSPLNHDTAFVLFSCTPTPLAKYLDDGLKTSSRLLGATKYMAVDRFDAETFRKQIDLILPPILDKSKSGSMSTVSLAHLGERHFRKYCRVGTHIYYGSLQREFRISV